MFQVILFTDAPYPHHRIRGYGVHRIASEIRANGYSCLVVDFSSALTFEKYKDLLDLTISEETLMIGFSTTWLPYRLPNQDGYTNEIPGQNIGEMNRFSSQKDETHDWRNQNMVAHFGRGEISEWLLYPKKLQPRVKVVLGGAKTDFYMDLEHVDNFIFGIAETMVIDYLDSISGKSEARIFNKYLDYDRKAHRPTWDFRKSQTQYTEYDFIQPQETLNLEVGRGCRFKCAFCNFPLIGQKNVNDYLKFPEVIKDELQKNYELWGTTKYFIVDDTFNDSTQKLEMFAKVMSDLPFDIKFWCYTRVDLLTAMPEQIELMKELGVAETFFGLETFNDKSSRTIGKGMPSSKRKDTLYKAKEVWGDRVWMEGGFMIGLPYETRASWRDTVDWLKRDDCPLDISTCYPLNITKKTERNRWFPLSWFDEHYEKFGYHFPIEEDSLEGLLYWEKSDETDIQNFEEASIIAEETTKELAPYQRTRRGDFYVSSFSDPRFSDREKTLDMTPQEYGELLTGVDFEELYFDTVNKDYFDKIFKKLRS